MVRLKAYRKRFILGYPATAIRRSEHLGVRIQHHVLYSIFPKRLRAVLDSPESLNHLDSIC